ncbi:MAG: hypothetical protein ACJA1B_001239 [Polaribacter sp.]|jgi:hypothetical protein
MIKFFRKIRQNLLSEGKTGKYLKYAIGEILLVVIGILIALSINNWNENRKNIAKKETLLKALKIEFSSNLTQLDTVLYYDDIVLKNIRRFMKLDPNNSVVMTSDSMPNWFQNSSFRWTYDPLNGALRSGISSGEIHLIQNDSLANLLFGWQDFVSDAKEGEVRTIAALVASKSITERHIRNIDYRNRFLPELGKSRFLSDYQSLFRDPLFEDYLTERYLSMNEVLDELNLVKKKNTLILKLIDIELNKIYYYKITKGQ